MLPFKREKPSRHAVRIKLCQGVADCNWEGMCLTLQREKIWQTTGENNRILGGIYGFSLLWIFLSSLGEDFLFVLVFALTFDLTT